MRMRTRRARWLLAAAVALLAAGRAEAQYGVGPGPYGAIYDPYQGLGLTGVPNGGYYGGGIFVPYEGLSTFGVPNSGFNWGLGLGSYTSWGGPSWYGMATPQSALYGLGLAESAALNASRYNLNNAEATTAYDAGNLYRRAALDVLRNARTPLRPSSGAGASGEDTGRARPAAGAATGGKRPATFREMIAPDGEVFWPLGAPDKGDLGSKRQAAGRAIREAVRSAKDGEASVRKVVAARQALGDYAEPAAEQLKEEHPEDVRGFATYIKTLDAGLRSLAGGGPGGNAGRAGGIEPPSAPRSAGQVLRNQVEGRSKSGKR